MSDETTQEELDTDSVEGSELEAYESAEVDDKEFLEEDQVIGIIESILFATDRPQSIAVIKQAFAGTNIKSAQIRRAIEKLQVDLAGARRGVSLEEIAGGYQLRTKIDHMSYLKRMLKARPFKLSGPALEVLSIVAYKQPCTKHMVDEIRGVESGHLLRGLMDKAIVAFAGKSELPGKPMLYQTTKRFLEIFGLRNSQELPSLSDIDELIPEGIGDELEEKESLGDITDSMAQEGNVSYSEGEEELTKISDQLSTITTSSDFFEEEKRRVREKRDSDRAQDIRDALTVGEEVEAKDQRWLERYDAKLAEANAPVEASEEVIEAAPDVEAVVQEALLEEVVPPQADIASMAVDAQKLAEDLAMFDDFESEQPTESAESVEAVEPEPERDPEASL